MKRASGSTCSRSPGMQKKRQSSSKPSGAPLELLDDLRQARQREEVGERAVALLDREPEHLAAQRRHDDRDLLRGRALELEAAVGALAGQGRPQEVDRLRHLRERLFEGHPVPALDDPVRGGADAEREAAVGGVREGRGLLGEQGAASLHHADDARSESDLLGPRGGQGERREAVGAVGLARPEVRVAGGLGAA